MIQNLVESDPGRSDKKNLHIAILVGLFCCLVIYLIFWKGGQFWHFYPAHVSKIDLLEKLEKEEFMAM